jgi:antirestriction protein ArdC
MPRGNFRKVLTERVCSFLEENDCLPWQRNGKAPAMRPFNPSNGTRFRGGNVVNLIQGALDRNSDDPRWMTLKQANDAGYRIRKGAKSELVEYWDWGDPPTPNDKPDKPQPLSSATLEASPTEESPADDALTSASADPPEKSVEPEPRQRRPLVFYARVFNGDDIVGLPPMRIQPDRGPQELVERLIKAAGAKIEYSAPALRRGKPTAGAVRFDEARDVIVMPAREAFKTQADFDATRLGQLAVRAVARTRKEALQSPGAREANAGAAELRAEIAREFLASMMGVEGTALGQVKHHPRWVETLKKDRHELFRAARDAEAVLEQLFERAPELKSLVNSRVQENILTARGPRKLDSGIGPLPNFAPAPPQPQLELQGLEDPRWQSFDHTLRREAAKYGIPAATLDKTVELLRPQFSDLMGAAGRNGYSVDDMNAMLVAELVDEMRSSTRREQQWDRFSAQARQVARPMVGAGLLEERLSNLQHQYQAVIQQSLRESWDGERTDHALSELLFGSEGSRPITADLVRERLLGGGAPRVLEDEDDLLLTPTAGGLFIQDALPSDAAAMADESLLTADGNSARALSRAASRSSNRRETSSTQEASSIGP